MENRNVVFLGMAEWQPGQASLGLALINILIFNDLDVVIGGSKPSIRNIQSLFPDITAYELPPISPCKSFYYKGAGLKRFGHTYASRKQYRQVQSAFKSVLESQHVDAILSLHLPWLYHSEIPSILIPEPGCGRYRGKLVFESSRATSLFSGIWEKYQEIWIPDTEDRLLGGALSDFTAFADQVRYLGTPWPPPVSQEKTELFDYALCAILSGEEPQRSRLENVLIQQAYRVDGRVALLRDKPGSGCFVHSTEKLNIFDNLDPRSATQIMRKSKTILCRPILAIIMELAGHGQTVLLVPEPGQDDQVYLGDYHEEMQHAHSVNQEALDLGVNLTQAMLMTGIPDTFRPNLWEHAIQDLLGLIKNNQIRGSQAAETH